jgi:hypothetical protein
VTSTPEVFSGMKKCIQCSSKFLYCGGVRICVACEKKVNNDFASLNSEDAENLSDCGKSDEMSVTKLLEFRNWLGIPLGYLEDVSNHAYDSLKMRSIPAGQRQCPSCKSTKKAHSKGYSPKGEKRFKCKNCDKSWTVIYDEDMLFDL